jgi:hypothetical protein
MQAAGVEMSAHTLAQFGHPLGQQELKVHACYLHHVLLTPGFAISTLNRANGSERYLAFELQSRL